MEKRDEITLVCTTLGKNPELLQRMLDSAIGFDEIHVKCQPELNIPDAYNQIIDIVDTEWVCCMPDDDYFYPENLVKMIAEIHKGIDADVAHFKFHVSGYVPPEDVRCWFGKKEYDLWEPKKITPELMHRHNRLPAASFFRKSAWELIGGFQGDKCHDWDLWKRMAQSGLKFKYFPHLIYNYVRRDNSAWVKQNS